jgi:hypothetical protein
MRHVDDGDQLAAGGAQYRDPVGEQQCLVHVVCDEHHRGRVALPYVDQQALHAGSVLCIQRSERLVHQQDPG